MIKHTIVLLDALFHDVRYKFYTNYFYISGYSIQYALWFY